MTFLKHLLKGLGVLLTAALAYLALWPIAVEPVAWTSEAFQGYAPPFAVNQELAGLQTIALTVDGKPEIGPEHVVIGPDGWLYAAVLSSHILRMQPDGQSPSVYATTGGRVLGFAFDAQGNIVAADAMRGLLSISPKGEVSVLTDQVNGQPIQYADAVDVAPNGKIYFSDASQRFGAKQFGGTFEGSVLDIFEQSCTGRLLEFDPATRQTRVVAQGLSFANGIAMASDGAHVFVSETGRYRVWKIATAAQGVDVRDASAAKAAGAQIVLHNLPGYPDNLMRGQPLPDGRAKLWLGFAKPRSALIDKLADQPFLRKVVLRLPRATWPVPKAYGHVIAFTEDGQILSNLQDPSGAYPETTGVTETADRLYIQSLHADRLGWRARP